MANIDWRGVAGRTTGVAGIMIAAWLGACGKSDRAVTSPADTTPTRLQIVGGDLQRGFADSTLDTLVTALVRGSSGSGIANARVHFTAAAGAGSAFDTTVTTDASGQASCLWRLGPVPGSQRLVAHLDTDSPAPANATAQAYSLSQADLVIVHNAVPGVISILELTNNTVYSTRQVTWPDTIVRFVPRDSNAYQKSVSAFELARAPDYAANPWTPGTDTIHLQLGAPIQLPLTFWIMHDYATTVALARADSASTDHVWQINPTGLRVGPIQFIDATALPQLNPPITCSSGMPGSVSTTVNVYYVPTDPATAPPSVGYTCAPGEILRGPVSNFSTVNLLAHELGHTFTLGHVTDSLNVMYSAQAGNTFTIAQIYSAFFSNQSSLNAIYGLRNIPPVPIPNLTRAR